MAQRAARGIKSLMVEGGSQLLASLFRLGLVDRFAIKHIPVIGGSAAGQGPGAPFLDGGAEGVAMTFWQVTDWRRICAVGVDS